MKPIQTQIPEAKLYDEFATVVAETEQLLKSVADAGSGKVASMRAGVEESLAAAAQRVAEIRSRAMSQASAAAKVTDQYVQDNPWRAVVTVAAFALITGLVAGLLVSRR